MLVCNISQLSRRASIAAGVTEATAASDAVSGIVAFAALVDEPATAGDRLDAFLGPYLVEAASAHDTVGAGLVYATRIAEAALATDLVNGSVPGVYAVTVAEAAAATETQDASIVAAQLNYLLAASRAGLRSSMVQPAAGKTQVVSNVGAVS